MGNILQSVKTKKEKNPDKFFGVGFCNIDSAYGTRGFDSNINMDKYVLKNRAEELKKYIDK
ncbi:hypothetical protein NO2_0499 [Candidatus Termititenax persephonae]|uniref:Uncharacterized protein n=1 Tax=Candidatus Termititenax persephonae TaxID=2218525 RepID=A0A388TFP1_9BACT|nr:hypothetical protein NO2_0499 [Candidatus Termititenax persephonae]